MRILFLNQYFPPDPAPTGVLLRELGDDLAKGGHEVEFISSGQSYRGGDRQRRRWVRELRALGGMLLHGIGARRADVVFSASSPPCLLAVATMVAWRHRAKSVHWVMDIYPELAVALGELRGGVLSRLIQGAMRIAYRSTDAVIALDEDMAACLQKYGVRSDCIRPWLPHGLLKESEVAAAPEGWTWIYSGNLGRAHEWQTLLDAQALLEARQSPFRLCFQGGGPSWLPAQSRARDMGLTRCDWSGYVDEDRLRTSLLRGRVLVATQKMEAQGLLWPSKLGLLLSLPRPVLWVGPTDGAAARLLGKNPVNGIFAPGHAAEIADWLEAIRLGAATAGVNALEDPVKQRAEALHQWATLLSDTLKRAGS